jgi:uncharacterized protein (DUF362 family)
VDLNFDDLVEVKNPDNFTGLPQFFLPRTIVSADSVISVAKLKTHAYSCMTGAMKNLFGVVPGRKYGWPKIFLHTRGIEHSIVDLVHLVKPQLAIIDGITAMEGLGPLDGTARNANVLIAGTDLAAVDATCARIMGMNPNLIPMLKLAGQVLGNIDDSQIDIVGAPVSSVTQSFLLPPVAQKLHAAH